MYKRSETNSPRTVSENNEHADTEEKTGELNDQLMQNLKYYSLLVYDHNEDAKEFSYTTNCLEENNERIESISPKRPHSVMVDTPRKKIIESKKARQVSLLGIENNHDTLENGFDIITNEAKLFPLRTKSSSSENTDIEIHDLEEILRTRKQKSVFHTEITPEPETVLLKVPTRFTCHRCNHMMCPYCPKVRVKDLTP